MNKKSFNLLLLVGTILILSTNINAVPRNGGHGNIANNDIVVTGYRLPPPTISVGNLGGNGLDGANVNIPNLVVRANKFSPFSDPNNPFHLRACTWGDAELFSRLLVAQLTDHFEPDDDTEPDDTRQEKIDKCDPRSEVIVSKCKLRAEVEFSNLVNNCVTLLNASVTIGIPGAGVEVGGVPRVPSECRAKWQGSRDINFRTCEVAGAEYKAACLNIF